MMNSSYRMTEVGLLPDDWDVKPFSECFTLIRNNTYARECLTDHPGSVANVHYGDVLIKYGAVLDFAKNAVPYLKSDVKPNKDMLRDGDLVFADTAEDEAVGKAVEVQGLESSMAVAGLHTVASRPHDGLFAPRYLGYYINSAAYHNQLLPLITGTKVSSVSRAGFLSTYVAIPLKGEQERIAEALSDVDALLSAMTTLIEKKRAIKQGAMQELLGMQNGECGMRNVPRRRLAGFSGEWIEKRLGDCGTAIRGVSYKPCQAFYESGAGRTMLLRSNNIQGNVLSFDDVVYVSEDCIGDEQYMRCGDILICAANGSRNLVGKSAVLKTMDQTVTFGAFMAIFRANSDIDAGFAGYLLQTESYRKQLDDILTGSAINNLNSKDILGLAFAVPPTLAEQHAIAAVLADMDAEIAALEAKRTKYERIKQGMMQELLTGKTRLKGD